MRRISSSRPRGLPQQAAAPPGYIPQRHAAAAAEAQQQLAPLLAAAVQLQLLHVLKLYRPARVPELRGHQAMSARYSASAAGRATELAAASRGMLSGQPKAQDARSTGHWHRGGEGTGQAGAGRQTCRLRAGTGRPRCRSARGGRNRGAAPRRRRRLRGGRHAEEAGLGCKRWRWSSGGSLGQLFGAHGGCSRTAGCQYMRCQSHNTAAAGRGAVGTAPAPCQAGART